MRVYRDINSKACGNLCKNRRIVDMRIQTVTNTDVHLSKVHYASVNVKLRVTVTSKHELIC